MMLTIAVLSFLVVFVSADDPIIQLTGNCPPLQSGDPSLELTADVPAYALARCRNGDQQLTSTNEVHFNLAGSFDQSFAQRCQFYKKDGSNTYTVDVEVGWGERDSQVVQQRKIKTISCAYDAHGRAISSTETISDWFLNPWESQHLLGGNATAIFALQIWDVLDNEITSDHISIGRKIRLVAFDTTNRFPAFRALSCQARNSHGRYYVLRAGCGDGLVFRKISGFRTEGNCVYSPYFEAFKLSGADDTIEFECVFTVCDHLCNGSSCPTEVGGRRQKRSVPDNHPYIVARTGTINFRQ